MPTIVREVEGEAGETTVRAEPVVAAMLIRAIPCTGGCLGMVLADCEQERLWLIRGERIEATRLLQPNA